MNKALREAPGAALRCLLDGTIWWALVRALLAWRVFGCLVGALLLLLVGGFVAAMLPRLAHDLVNAGLAFIVTAWLVPPAVRRGCAIIVPRAVGGDPATPTLPMVAEFRGWWMPLLLTTEVLPGIVAQYVEPFGLVDARLLALAVFAVQLVAARKPIVRSVLAPVLPRQAIDAVLAARRSLWLLVTLGYMVAGTIAYMLATAISGRGGAVLYQVLAALETNHLQSLVLLRIAAAFVTFLGVEILCTSALAHVALGLAAPGALGKTSSATTRAAARPARPFAWLAVMVVAVAGAFLMRAQLAYQLLGDEHFRQRLTNHRDWSESEARQTARTQLACLGRADKLRLLAWAGVRGDRGVDDKALGCAAYHGHLDAVKVLVDTGDDIDRAVAPESAPGAAMPQTPLQQAVRTTAGLPVADWLLAHHAQPHPSGAGADLVQTAAAWNCLPCVEWLHQRGFAMDATAPATPMTLWLDLHSFGDIDDVGALHRLIELGMSPSAVGEDGRSALHAAAAAANPSAVDLLLANGADPVLPDANGMTPLLYAAHGLHQVNPSDTDLDNERRRRREGVILKLMALSPSLDAQGRPSGPPRRFIATFPYVMQNEELGRAAGLDPAIRAAAAQSGKAIRYEDASFIAKLSQDEAFATFAPMDDAQMAIVLRPNAWLTGQAAKLGWWPPLVRAMRVWPRPAGQARVWPACDVLRAAIAGDHDNSPTRADSWAVVDAWLEAGMKPVDCGTRSTEEAATLERRSPAQLADWKARTAGIDAATRP